VARPLKQGLDYFPLDVDIDQDDKLQLIEALYGVKGFGIVIKLFMRIYKEGFCYKWTETEQLLFSKRVNEDINLVTDVVNDCIKYSVFDEGMYNDHKVLTSKGIQKRYFEAVTRRKTVEADKNHLLINVEEYVNVNRTVVNVDINPKSVGVNTNIGTQSKVKERKGENIVEQKLDVTPYKEVIEYLNIKTGKNFKHTTAATKKYIHARSAEGATLEDFKKVIDTKVKDWLHVEQSKYLRPETLFGTKFDGYLNESPVKGQATHVPTARPKAFIEDLGED